MSLLENLKSLLGPAGTNPEASPEGDGETETVRRIVAELEAMDPPQARRLAAFAYILSRVANADLTISAEESRKMEEIVARVGGLPARQAVLVVQIAKSQNRLFGGTENFLVTREFAEIATREEREHLVDCLFAVSAADDSISGAEEAQVRQIASELGFTHGEYVDLRSRWSDKREVLRGLRG
jgi:uncharacterized tellurite resistance protein B-like protein